MFEVHLGSRGQAEYIPKNPAAAVKHFNELRERPVRRMLTVEEELGILEAAPPHLRVATASS